MNKTVAVMAAACVQLLSVSSCVTWSPAPERDIIRYELSGDVASVRTVTFGLDSTVGGYVTGSMQASTNNGYVEFNEDGMITLLERTGKNGNTVSTLRNTYNQGGKKISSVLTSASGEVLETERYEYRGGHLQSMTQKDGSDSVKKSEVYEYYGKDSVKTVFTYGDGDEPDGYRIQEYDEDGNNVRTVTYSKNGKKISEFLMRYDSLGRRSGMDSESLFFGKMSTEMTYGDNGFCSLLKMRGENGNEMELSFSFKTDSCGNWTQRVLSQDGKPTKVEVREITYRK